MSHPKHHFDGHPVRISFLGNFGQGNLGNEATLRAILDNLQKALPNAEMNCICTNPAGARATHHIDAFPMHETFLGPEVLRTNWLSRIVRKIFVGAPAEFYRWIQALKFLGKSDMLIVPGTQFLSDILTGPWGGPYLLFRWSLAAKLRRCKVVFASVGVGPLYHPLSRFFVKCALHLAEFRSYRDNSSKDYLQKIGFKSSTDPVYPDLAFSLSTPSRLLNSGNHSKSRVVALGVLDHYGQLVARPLRRLSPQDTYRRYVERMTDFATWLLEHDYSVRLVIGDVTYDSQVLVDIQNALKQRVVKCEGRLIVEPIESLKDLLSQLARSDIVVSPRFHNIVFGMLLNRPVLALSYHEKFSALLEPADLAKFNVPIDWADARAVTAKLCELEKDRDELNGKIHEAVKRYQRALSEQYEQIVRLVHTETRPASLAGTLTSSHAK